MLNNSGDSRPPQFVSDFIRSFRFSLLSMALAVVVYVGIIINNCNSLNNISEVCFSFLLINSIYVYI